MRVPIKKVIKKKVTSDPCDCPYCHLVQAKINVDDVKVVFCEDGIVVMTTKKDTATIRPVQKHIINLVLWWKTEKELGAGPIIYEKDAYKHSITKNNDFDNVEAYDVSFHTK